MGIIRRDPVLSVNTHVMRSTRIIRKLHCLSSKALHAHRIFFFDSIKRLISQMRIFCHSTSSCLEWTKRSCLHSFVFWNLLANIDVLDRKSLFIWIVLPYLFNNVTMTLLKIKVNIVLRTIDWLSILIFIVRLFYDDLLWIILYQVVWRVGYLLIIEAKMSCFWIRCIHMCKSLLYLSYGHLHGICLCLHFSQFLILKVLRLLCLNRILNWIRTVRSFLLRHLFLCMLNRILCYI